MTVVSRVGDARRSQRCHAGDEARRRARAPRSRAGGDAMSPPMRQSVTRRGFLAAMAATSAAAGALALSVSGAAAAALPTVATGTLLGPAARSASERAIDATRAAHTSGESPNIDQMTSAQAQTSAIRPFVVDVPDEDIRDLRRRLTATRWPSQETVADRTQGVQLAKVQALVQYWATDYDWRRVESRLNALPQFMTQIDGLD